MKSAVGGGSRLGAAPKAEVKTFRHPPLLLGRLLSRPIGSAQLGDAETLDPAFHADGLSYRSQTGDPNCAVRSRPGVAFTKRSARRSDAPPSGSIRGSLVAHRQFANPVSRHRQALNPRGEPKRRFPINRDTVKWGACRPRLARQAEA